MDNKQTLEWNKTENKFIFTGDFTLDGLINFAKDKAKEFHSDKKEYLEKAFYLDENHNIYINAYNIEQGKFRTEFIVDNDLVGSKSFNIELIGNLQFIIKKFQSDKNQKDIFSAMKFQDIVISDSINNSYFKIDKLHLTHINSITKLIINNIQAKELFFKHHFGTEIMNLDEVFIGNTTFEKDSKFHLKKLKVKEFTLSDISQEWTEAIFENITVTEKLKLENIDLRKAKFIQCDFSDCEIEISDSVYISETIFNGTKFNKNLDDLSQEVSRQFKTTLDNQGNFIEANKFYSQEMRAYQNSLNKDDSFEDKSVFWLNKYISNFGQSWLLPIFWFFVITMGFIVMSEPQDIFNQFHTNIKDYKAPIIQNLPAINILYFIIGIYLMLIVKPNNILWYIPPLFAILYIYYFHFNCNFFIALQTFGNYMSIPNMHPSFNNDVFGWFLHKAILSILIYHLTIALRRQTKR